MIVRKQVFTIGHSTRTTREFMKILKAFDVEVLVDVRHYPGSRHCPQFEKSRLKRNLKRNKIEYAHIVQLGGRRRPNKLSTLNAGWRSAQFRGYADHMQTEQFSDGFKQLLSLAEDNIVAIMCAEAVPWRCHRSMIADALIVNGFEVIDLFGEKQARLHALTSFAKVRKKKITYPEVLADT